MTHHYDSSPLVLTAYLRRASKVSATAGVPINLTFVNKIWTYTWKANTTDGSYSEDGCGSRTGVPCGPLGGGIEVHRGPLSFALRPDSTVEETTIGCIGGEHPPKKKNRNQKPIIPPAFKCV